MERIAAYNTGFASGGVTCKLGALCFYSSVVLVDSFVLRNPPERKARKRCASAKQKRHCTTENFKQYQQSVMMDETFQGQLRAFLKNNSSIDEQTNKQF